MVNGRDLRAKISAGRSLFGVVLRSAETEFAELVGLTGFDFGWIDLEHSTMSFKDGETLVIALQGRGCVPIVRVPRNDAAEIGRAFDMGAAAVCVPHVDTAAEAARVAAAGSYHPRGRRGFTSASRSNELGTVTLDAREMERQNAENMLMAQIESAEAMKNLDEIARVDGVDLLFLGMYDLAQDLGVAGKHDDPRVVEMARRFGEVAARHGRIAATVLPDPGLIPSLTAMGFRMFTAGMDLNLMRNALADLRASIERGGR